MLALATRFFSGGPNMASAATRWISAALLVAAALVTACAEQRYVPPPSPRAAAGMPPATVRAAVQGDVTGAWQMLVLPPDIAQQVNLTDRFDEPWQYMLVGDGRVGFLASPEAPNPLIDAAGLRAMFDREPSWNTYTVVGGVVTVTSPQVTGFAIRRDVWHVDIVTSAGAFLGLAVLPGDAVMYLRDASGQNIHRRVMRRMV